MPWKADVIFDTNDPNAGTVTAIFTALTGETFTYSRRVTRGGADVDAFVAEAKAGLSAAAAQKTQRDNAAQAIEAKLNG